MTITQQRGHAKDIARTWRNDIDGDIAVLVGGDGLMHEFVNGLMSTRKERTFTLFEGGEFFKEGMDDPAIAAVPAGSGNGVATSLGFEMADVEGTAVSLIKNIQIDFDLLKCTFDEGATDADGTPVSEPVYSIASVYWGIVAQVDHRSERFRFLGGFRFTLEALISIFTFKPEQACILLHRASNNIVLSARSSEWYNIEYDEMFYTNILVANCPYVTYDMKFAPHAEVSRNVRSCRARAGDAL